MKTLCREWGLLVLGLLVGGFFIRFMYIIMSTEGVFTLFILKYLNNMMG